MANIDYIEAFRTTEFSYTADSIIDMEIQPFYDGSVNIITTSEGKKPRIVNSRQRFDESTVELVVRNNDNLDNVYEPAAMDRTLLIPHLDGSIIPTLTFIGVEEGDGKLINGGYKYYFRFKTADGIESPIFDESRLVSVHMGNEYGKAYTLTDTTATTNAVKFQVTNVNMKIYKYVSVYYTLASGQTETTTKTAYKVNKDYEIVEGVPGSQLGTCDILHTGYETDAAVDISKITVEYAGITSAAAVTQNNNRLMLANVKVTPTTNQLLREAALRCRIDTEPNSKLFTEQILPWGNATVDDTFAKPYNIYYKLGYFPGETYEFAVNFVFKDGSVSKGYPIMGFDFDQVGIGTPQTFNDALLGQDIGWDSGNGHQNSYGVVRMKDKKINELFTQSVSAGQALSKMDSYSMTIDTSNMVANNATALQALGITTYFISRKKRIPDLVMEGMMTLAGGAPVNSMITTETNLYMGGFYTGYGTGDSANRVIFPLPGCAQPFSSESLQIGGDTISSYSFDGVLYASAAGAATTYSLYSPDITSDAANAAVFNTAVKYGVQVDAFLSQIIAFSGSSKVRSYGNIGTNPSLRVPYATNPYRFTTKDLTYPINSLQYVYDGYRSYTSGTFTGRLDRQAALALYATLRSQAKFGEYNNAPGGGGYDACQIIDRDYQYTYLGTTTSIAHTDLAASCSGVPVSAVNPSTQIPMTSVKYSPYFGIKMTGGESTISDALNITHSSTASFFSAYTATGATPGVNCTPGAGTTEMGAMIRLYTNSYGRMNITDWLAKYQNKKEGNYSAITRRYPITHSVKDTGVGETWRDAYLSGGDCYSSIYYQRVWRPGGIDGVPTANSPVAYQSSNGAVTREGSNITNSGYAMGFPVRSKYNFAIRALEKVDDTEYKLYGKHRTATESDVSIDVRGDRQPETGTVNYGNMIDESVLSYIGYDPNIPYTEIEYDNRVFTSEVSVVGEFENGYRNFSGLVFKDYDAERGEIVATVSKGLYTYLIYKNGVSLIEPSERTAISSGAENTNVFIASADVLPPKSSPIFTDIGSQHLKSVLDTEIGIFGVDADAKKIWYISDNDRKIISDMRIQRTLNESLTSTLKNIYTSYDVAFNELTFVFEYNDASQRSLVYNTVQDAWCGTSDIHKIYQFGSDETTFSLQKTNNQNSYHLYYPVLNRGDNANFPNVGKATATNDLQSGYKEVYDSYMEFIIKVESLNKFNLTNIVINGVGTPASIDVFAESLEEYKIATPPSSVAGINMNSIPVHTNIYMQDAPTGALTYINPYRFTRARNVDYKLLSIGDKITLNLNNGTFQQFTIANVTFNSGSNTDTIILDHAMSHSTMTQMYYGWKIPLRMSLGENMGGKTKLSVPTSRHAAALSGTSRTSQQNYVNYASAKPYGRWVKVRLNFKGIDQIYIDSVISNANIRYS